VRLIHVSVVLACLWLLSGCATTAYQQFAVSGLAGAPATHTRPGLLLMGGGEWPPPAVAWFAEQAGHGRLVILRAAGTTEVQDDFVQGNFGFSSIETLVFHSRAAASDPLVLARLRQADAIFIGGGDQSKYVRAWQHTPLSRLLEEHVAAGKPLGGTSAGLAILGAYSYGAMDGGSLLSRTALRAPYGTQVTLVENFLHLPYLSAVITDSHFAIRQRLGRLITFVTRLSQEHHDPAIVGLGVDEQAALCVEADGTAHLYTNTGGYAWLVRAPRTLTRVTPDAPLTVSDVSITGIDVDSTLDLKTMSVLHPAFQWDAAVSAGKLQTIPVEAL